MAFGGYACLAALLGWGVSYRLELLVERLFAISVDEIYLALGAVILVALNRSFGRHGPWRTRMRIVYMSLPVLLVLVG
jgi:hypothetical protein